MIELIAISCCIFFCSLFQLIFLKTKPISVRDGHCAQCKLVFAHKIDFIYIFDDYNTSEIERMTFYSNI